MAKAAWFKRAVGCGCLSLTVWGCSGAAGDDRPAAGIGGSLTGGGPAEVSGGRGNFGDGGGRASGGSGPTGGAPGSGGGTPATGGDTASGGLLGAGGAVGGSQGAGGSSGGSCEEPDPCGVCGGDGSSCECADALCQAIVKEHNTIRTRVNAGDYYDQPAADPPILRVVWDPLIAAKAQEYADSMDDWSMGHSSQQFRTYKSSFHDGYHGENMAIGGGRYAEPSYFVAEGWGASEAQGCLLSECGGHYTQIVWRETVAIGCGRKEGVTFDGNVGTLTVCQYGPGGNINGRDPY